jgi:hypothetical protein
LIAFTCWMREHLHLKGDIHGYRYC